MTKMLMIPIKHMIMRQVLFEMEQQTSLLQLHQMMYPRTIPDSIIRAQNRPLML